MHFNTLPTATTIKPSNTTTNHLLIMNFLHAAVLSAIVIEYVSASADVEAQFRTAVDDNDLATAATVCKENRSLCSKGIDYVIERKPFEFVVGFIKAAGEVNTFTLARVYKKTSEAVKNVLDGLSFSDYDFTKAEGVNAPTPTRTKFYSRTSGATWEALATIKKASELVKQTSEEATKKASEEAIKKASEAIKKASGLIEKVLDGINFTDHDLAEVASKREQACVPQHFLGLISRIKSREVQAYAVRGGISNLFPEHMDCLDPLLDALEGSASVSDGLKKIAIQTVFEGATRSRKDDLVKRFYRHPAVTHEVYAEGLISSWNIDERQNMVFQILLEQADVGDLEAAKKSKRYESASALLHEAIKEGLPNAKLKGPRIRK